MEKKIIGSLTIRKLGNEIVIKDNLNNEGYKPLALGSTVAKEARKFTKEGWVVTHRVTPTTMWELRKFEEDVP